MKKVSSEDIQKVKETTNLVDLVRSKCLDLKDGSNGDWIGRCPFHDEKTPSFRVNEKRFHCFGCGIHGDIFTWLQKTEGLSFGVALERLGYKNGIINIPPRSIKRQFSDVDIRAKNAIIKMNETAQQFFVSTKNEIAEKYITSRLGAAFDIKNDIGYAPSGRSFISFMQDAGYGLEELKLAGLLGQGNMGDYYPRLIERITIPLKDSIGRILGFSGRLLEAHSTYPKWVNSPNTYAFHRGRFLYGLDRLPKGRLDYVFLVEGYTDTIALRNLGVTNVLSCMGTHATKEQINLLEQLTSKVYLMMDGDLPGLEASIKLLKLMFDANFDTYAILLPNGLDPDVFASQAPNDLLPQIQKLPRISIRDLYGDRVVTKALKVEYNRSRLDELIKPYVEDNIKHGWSHYNIVDWVMQAYPQFAKEIHETTLKMVQDTEPGPDGRRNLKDEHIKAFIKAWMKPSREVRKTHGYK